MTPKPAPQQSAMVGDRVTTGDSDTVYEITQVSADGLDVTLALPRTNLQRFRVPVRTLKWIDRKQAAKPAVKEPDKPRIDIDGINERLVIAQHDAVQQLSNQIMKLKEQLKTDGAPAKVTRDLDKLCAEVEESWDASIRSIMQQLESN